MHLRQELILPQTEAFYTTPLLFSINVDSFACRILSLNGAQFTVGKPSLLASALSAANKTLHSADLESVSIAALRFFRTSGVRSMAPAEYATLLYLTRYHWGLAFEHGKTGSLQHAEGPLPVLHSEATKPCTEQVAYGLAVHFLATMLGIPTDRFFFVSGSGARPDFTARISLEELRSNGICALSPSGHVIQLEVKARTGWASSRSTGKQGLALLQNLSTKSATNPNNAFVSVIVSLPNKKQSRSGRSRTKLIVVDPGEPKVLAESAQLMLLLEESLPLLIRHGLWQALVSALNWLGRLRELSRPEKDLIARFDGGRPSQPQSKITVRQHEGRTFNGRIFSDVVLRLGQPGERAMTRSEAENRLALGEFGSAWFSGADISWLKIIQTEDATALLRYGVRGEDTIDLSAKSAFRMADEPMEEDIRNSVRIELNNALKRWS